MLSKNMLQNVSIKMSGSYDEYSQRVPEDFLINSLTSSFVGMIRWWLKNKMHPGPEVVAGYYMALINPAIAEFQRLQGDQMGVGQAQPAGGRAQADDEAVAAHHRPAGAGAGGA